MQTLIFLYVRGGSDIRGWVGDVCFDAVAEWAVVTTLAGGVSGTNGAFADGSGSNAGFNTPFGLTVDVSGNVFVADGYNHRIRKVTSGGGTHCVASKCNDGAFP
jgi:serine/threonine-protein kinase